MTRTINLDAALAKLDDHWKPQEIGRVNDTALKVVKIHGSFPRHQHEHEDECFLVLDGQLVIDFDDGPVTANTGECIIVPKGVHHAPRCDDEVKLLLIEPATTVQYGDAGEEAVTTARSTVGAPSG